MDGPKLWGARIKAMAHIWAHRGPPASPNPHAACPGPGGWGTPRGTQPLGCPSAIPNTPGRGQGFTPWSAHPPHMKGATSASPRGAAHPQTPPGAQLTHRQLLVGGHLVRQGPDPLIGAVHPQPGAQPRQLLIAPRVVPAWGEEAMGSTGHRWALLGMVMVMAMGTATRTPYRGQGHLPVVVGGEDGSQHHLLPPDDLQQLEGARSSRR